MNEKTLVSLLFEELEKQKHPLCEGRGMPFRKKGDVYVEPDGNELALESVVLFPPRGGSYKTPEQTQDALDAFLEKNNIYVEKEVNAPNLAAMLVVLEDQTGDKWGYIRYFKEMKLGGAGLWSETNFEKDTGLKAKAKAGKITSKETEALPLKPSDLVGDEKERTPKQVANVVLKNAKTKLPKENYLHLEQLFRAALQNQSSPVLKGAAPFVAAYDKYLGEIFAPVSLVTGWLAQGDREESERVLLDNEQFSECLISFGMNPNEKLIDSKVVPPEGAFVGVSSKAGKGAAATTTNLLFVAKNLEKRDPRVFRNFARKHSKFLDILQTIANNDYWDGPVELARKFGMLSKPDLAILQKVKENRNLSQAQFVRQIKLSQNLRKLTAKLKGVTPYEMKRAPANYVPAHHIISGIAKAVVEKINSTPEFEKGVRALLIYGGMVQINSRMKVVNKTDAQFEAFVVKFPPSFKGKIVADAAKNYSAGERIRDKIAFKMI